MLLMLDYRQLSVLLQEINCKRTVSCQVPRPPRSFDASFLGWYNQSNSSSARYISIIKNDELLFQIKEGTKNSS